MMGVLVAFLVLNAWCYLATTGSAFESCPVPTGDQIGICSEDCSSDEGCELGQKCCSNGCGHSCTDAVSIPFYDLLLQCPDYLTATDCELSCQHDSDCGQGQLCCRSDCGTQCVEGVPPPAPCSAIREAVMNQSLIGAYVPQCGEDGWFSPVQCHASTGLCWCVHTRTGEPLGDMFRAQGDDDSSPCANCVYHGWLHFVGEEFPAGDGCNNCVCQPEGLVACSEFPVPCNPEPVHDHEEFFSCPPVERGICAESCSNDSQCQSGQKCCPTDCGHSCVREEVIPYIPPPVSCPEPDTMVGICDASCAESGCLGELQCCPNLCGSTVCVKGVTTPSPCIAIQQKLGNSSLLGSFVPECDLSSGRFQPLQCHSRTCWCVDPETGRPQSGLVASSDVGMLECTGKCPIDGQVYLECGSPCPPTCALVGTSVACAQVCTAGCQCLPGTVLDETTAQCVLPQDCSNGCLYGGQFYKEGDQVGSSDGCNTCSCEDGEVVCTDAACAGAGKDVQQWHIALVASGGVLALLCLVLLTLVIVVIAVMRQNKFRHQRLKDVNFAIVDEEHFWHISQPHQRNPRKVDAVAFKKEPEGNVKLQVSSNPVST